MGMNTVRICEVQGVQGMPGGCWLRYSNLFLSFCVRRYPQVSSSRYSSSLFSSLVLASSSALEYHLLLHLGVESLVS